MKNALAIIAGSGSFPFHVARESARQGRSVVAIGLEGWADPALARHASVYEEVSIGQLGRLAERLNAHQVRQAVMAGKVTKEILFDPRVQFDADALAIIGRAKEFSVNSLLGAIGDFLAQHGVTLLDSSTFLKDSLCPAGPATRRGPTDEEQDDIRVGVEAARQLALLDVGQTVVVKRRVIVAVEALEGTDATIRRAGEVGGPGGVVVKMASPTQDMRFDLPVVGTETIAVAVASGIRCLAIEAGKALLLDRDAVIRQADEAGLCLVGIEPNRS